MPRSRIKKIKINIIKKIIKINCLLHLLEGALISKLNVKGTNLKQNIHHIFLLIKFYRVKIVLFQVCNLAPKFHLRFVSMHQERRTAQKYYPFKYRKSYNISHAVIIEFGKSSNKRCYRE